MIGFGKNRGIDMMSMKGTIAAASFAQYRIVNQDPV
jgi:hypothetical protein